MIMLTQGPYLNLNDAEKIFEKLRYNRKGITAYRSELMKIASRSTKGAYIFKDELKLWNVIQAHLGTELSQKKIDSFGALMQYMD